MMQTFKFTPSRYLAALLVTGHLVAIMALIPLALPLWSRLILALALAVNLACLLRRDVLLQAPASCIALSVGNGRVEILTRNGEQLSCRLLRSSLVTPFITVINVLPQGARLARSAVLLPDGLDAESFRQLRVWLKWGA